MRKSAPWIPEDVEAVVMRALEKLPEKRFASASAMAEALDRAARA